MVREPGMGQSAVKAGRETEPAIVGRVRQECSLIPLLFNTASVNESLEELKEGVHFG